MSRLSAVLSLCCLVAVVLAGATMSADPPMLAYSGQNVSISWSGVATPSYGDQIYISVNGFPIGTVNASLSSTWATGAGSVNLTLMNMRTVYTIYYAPNLASPAVCSVDIDFMARLAEPTNVRLALTNESSQMRVMWTSAVNNTGAPTAEYGVSPDALTQNATGVSLTYTVNQMCAAPATSPQAFVDPGFQHDVLLTDLKPATTYYYRVGNQNDGWTDVLSFVSMPVPNASSEAWVIAYGDLGAQPSFKIYTETNNDEQEPSIQSVRTAVDLITTNPNVPWSVLHIGDISYARGWAYLWDYFMGQVEPLASRVPYMVGIGNHEYDYVGQPFDPSWSGYGTDSGGECGVPYAARFHMPEPSPMSPSRNLWYSYNHGPIHFVIMSTEHDFLVGSPQYEWIAADLAAVDRSVSPWVIFAGHRPMYSSTSTQMGMTLNIQAAYEPLFRQYEVQLAFWGHVHDYERTCGILINGTCAANDNDGTVHVVIGMAGNTFQTPWMAEANPTGFHHLMPNWIVYRSMQYGISWFHATETTLSMYYVANTRGLTHDSFSLTTDIAARTRAARK